MNENTFIDRTGKFEYRMRGDETAAIIHCLESVSDLVIPETLDGLTVSTLRDDAVRESIHETVFIPKSVSLIEEDTFAAENLREIIVAADNHRYCAASGMLVEKWTKTLLFCPPKLSVPILEVPEDIRTIGNFAFSCCSGLKKVILPEYLETIGAGAFEHCTEMTDIYVPGRIEHMGNYTFDNCPKLTVWANEKLYAHLWGYFRESPNLNVRYITGKPEFFRLVGI